MERDCGSISGIGRLPAPRTMSAHRNHTQEPPFGLATRRGVTAVSRSPASRRTLMTSSSCRNSGLPGLTCR
eukprot:5321092-Prymnesium_polylepis.1